MGLQPGGPIIRPNKEGIPQELKKLPIWQVWRAEGTQKVPYISKTTRFSKKYAESRIEKSQPIWLTFDQAWALYEENQDFFDGIQLHLDGAAQAGKPLVVIDLDYCRDPGQGNVTRVAANILSAFPGTWAEYSPSGTGMHIFFFNINNYPVEDYFSHLEYPNEFIPGLTSSMMVECFTRGRPMCITGVSLNDKPVMEIEDHELREFGRLYLDHKKAPTSFSIYPAQQGETHTADEIEECFKRARNTRSLGPECKYLFMTLDIDAFNQETQGKKLPDNDVSDWTIRLLNAISFYTRDPYTMCAVFERSALYASYDEEHLKKWAGSGGRRQVDNAIRTRNPANMFNWTKKKEVQEDDKQADFSEPMLSLDIKKRLDFPIEVLPGPLKAFVKDVSTEFQIPYDFAGVGALTMAAMAVTGKYMVNVNPRTNDYKTSLAEFSIIIGRSGADKSNVYNKLRPPLMRYADHKKAEMAPKIAKRNSDRHLLTIQIQETEKVLRTAYNRLKTGKNPKNAPDIDILELEKELSELNERLIDMPELHEPIVFFTGNQTIEAFAKYTAQNGGHMNIFSDEGSQFVKSVLGRYSQGTDVEPYIQIYNNGRIDEARIGRGCTTIDHANGCILLFTQPGEVEKLLADADATGQGFTNRCAIIEPENVPEYTFNPNFKCNGWAHEEYEDTIYELFSIPYPANPMDNLIQMEEEAFMKWGQFNQECKNHARNQDSEYAYIGEFMAKLADKAVRFAGVLHVLEHGPQAVSVPISGQTMDKGIKLAKYIRSHFAYQNGYVSHGTVGAAVDVIKDILDLHKRGELENNNTTIKARNICKKHSKGAFLHYVENVNPVLGFLENHGVLKYLEPVRGKGRPAADKYLVNSNLFTPEGLKSLEIKSLEP